MLGLLLAVLVVAVCAYVGHLNGHTLIGTAVGVGLVVLYVVLVADPRP